MGSRQDIFLYTDGAASGNPGPGGYGIVLVCGHLRKEMNGGFKRTTNNRMELLAVIKGLEAIKWEKANVHVFSDSTYVVRSVNEGWLAKWVANGFKKAKNPDLWKRFVDAASKHNVDFTWIKGHAGHPENECCDHLAVAAYSGTNLPDDEGYQTAEENRKEKTDN